MGWNAPGVGWNAYSTDPGGVHERDLDASDESGGPTPS